MESHDLCLGLSPVIVHRIADKRLQEFVRRILRAGRTRAVLRLPLRRVPRRTEERGYRRPIRRNIRWGTPGRYLHCHLNRPLALFPRFLPRLVLVSITDDLDTLYLDLVGRDLQEVDLSSECSVSRSAIGVFCVRLDPLPQLRRSKAKDVRLLSDNLLLFPLALVPPHRHRRTRHVFALQFRTRCPRARPYVDLRELFLLSDCLR